MSLKSIVVGFLGILVVFLSFTYDTTAIRQINLRDMHYIHQIKSDGTPLHAGEIVKVRGIVVVPPGIFSRAIYIYDPESSRGVQVYGVTLTTVKIGDLVEVTGEITHYNGETEIKINSEANVTILSRGNSFKAERIYTDNAYNEIYEGSFVEVCGKVESVNVGSGYFFLNDSSGRIQIYAPHLNINWITVGMHLSVTGVVGQYDKTPPYFSYYQIKPRFQNDIKNISRVKVWCGRSTYVPNAGEKVTIYTNISASEIYLNYTSNNWSSYTRVPMQYNPASSYYEAIIPGMPRGTLVRYVVEVRDFTSLWNYSIEYKYFVDSVKIGVIRKAPTFTTARIIGNVTVKPNTFSSDSVYIQNESYGIKVVYNNIPANINYTHALLVHGYLVRTRYNDVYISAKNVSVFAEGSPVEPTPKSIREAIEEDCGALIRVSGTVVSIDAYGFNISDGTYTIRVYNASSSQIPWLAVGKRVIVVGVQAQYYEPQILIRSSDDVQEIMSESRLISLLLIMLIMLFILGVARSYEKK